MIGITGSLQLWTGRDGSSHFMTVPEVEALDIRAHAFTNPRGFGSVRAECTIADVTWRTSLFPQKGGGYFLPVKAEVCRRAGIAVGDQVRVELELL